MRTATKFAIAFASVVGVMAFPALASVGPDHGRPFGDGQLVAATAGFGGEVRAPEAVLIAGAEFGDRPFFNRPRPFFRPNFVRPSPFFFRPRPFFFDDDFFFEDDGEEEFFFDREQFFDREAFFDRERDD